ncbi:ATP-binding protein [Bacillus sp. YC2]|uniref:ATP-binding protein n=1 Tax=Bacillus sp. YC2 TaxID=2861287 RepID=UPI001CA794FC|nr:ATP-binding protein [Bacillus sp. YC2]MBY8911930.1 ATP-binding protein [Bacillus sp. YC2]
MDTILTRPSAAPVLQALRSIGYKAKTAIADIVDNAIDAQASKIKLHFEYDKLNGYIKIKDNGNGMSEEEIQTAMNIGSKDPRAKRSLNELGRFGMGLKTASFSLGKRLSVITKKDGVYHERCWDLDYVSECNEWNLLTYIPSPVKEIAGEINRSSGTIIIIDKLDRFMRSKKIQRKTFFSKTAEIQKHLEFVFHDLIGNNKINISINDIKLTAWDPFMTKHPSIIEGEETIWKLDGYNMKVKYTILPHASKLNQTEFKRAGGEKGWRDHQGLYIYRENRLLHYGDWRNLFPKNTQSQLARVRIDITNAADSDWHVDVKKSMVTIPEQAIKILRPIAKEARDISREIYYFRTQSSIVGGNIKGSLNTWEQSGKDSESPFVLNKSHPIYLELLKQLNEEQSRMLNFFLKLIEIGSPVNIIAVPQSEEEIYNFTDQQLEMVQRFADTMIQLGLLSTKKEIIEALMTQPGFEMLNENTLKYMLDKEGKE